MRAAISPIPRFWVSLLFLFGIITPVVGQQQEPLTAIYPADTWEQIDQRVDKALIYLANNQIADGSFQTGNVMAQPSVTAFSVMAFLARGHAPGQGPYGKSLTRAIDYTLSCQHPSGYFAAEGIVTNPRFNEKANVPPNKILLGEPNSIASSYNHAIASVMLAEVFGMVEGEQSIRLKSALDRALAFTYQLQDKKKDPTNEGGWRYFELAHNGMDSDLSLTAWYLTFLRAAKNAGFEIPENRVERAVAYTQRSYSKSRKTFNYNVGRDENRPAMAGVGALCLALGGKHDDERLLYVSQTLQQINFNDLLSPRTKKHFPMYTCYYSSQAAAQIGGTCWRNTYYNLCRSLLSIQQDNGSWRNVWRVKWAGDCYSTSLAVLSLTTPYQLLPIYQR